MYSAKACARVKSDGVLKTKDRRGTRPREEKKFPPLEEVKRRVEQGELLRSQSTAAAARTFQRARRIPPAAPVSIDVSTNGRQVRTSFGALCAHVSVGGPTTSRRCDSSIVPAEPAPSTPFSRFWSSQIPRLCRAPPTDSSHSTSHSIQRSTISSINLTPRARCDHRRNDTSSALAHPAAQTRSIYLERRLSEKLQVV